MGDRFGNDKSVIYSRDVLSLCVLPLVLETIKTFEASLFGLSKSIGFEPPLISWPFLFLSFSFFQPRAGGTKTIWRLAPPLAALANGPKSSLTVIPTSYDFDNDVLPRPWGL